MIRKTDIKGILEENSNPKFPVIDASQSNLDARKTAFKYYQSLVVQGTEIDGFIIYLPLVKPMHDKEKLNNPFISYGISGSIFPNNDADIFINICKAYLPSETDKIEEIFKDAATNPP